MRWSVERRRTIPVKCLVLADSQSHHMGALVVARKAGLGPTFEAVEHW